MYTWLRRILGARPKGPLSANHDKCAECRLRSMWRMGMASSNTNPSGAASARWHDEFVETGERSVLQRILDYNEDDCRAMIVHLDGLRDWFDRLVYNCAHLLCSKLATMISLVQAIRSRATESRGTLPTS